MQSGQDVSRVPRAMQLLLRFLLVAVSTMLAVSSGSELQQPAAADDGHRYDQNMCLESFRCGDRLDIHYPFYLSNESKVIDGVAYSYCGYPGMAVICEDRAGTATLQLGGGDNYTVLDIDYANHTVTLADADALAAGGGGGCPRVRHNVTIPRGAWLNFSATGNDSISFFDSCAFTAAAPPPPEPAPINCSGVEQVPAPMSSFLTPTLDVPAGDWFRACNTVYVAPVLKEWLLSEEYYGRLGRGGYGEVLKRGFQLTWDRSAGPCYGCEESKGHCGYDQHGGFLSCLCSDRRGRGAVCGAGGHIKKTRKTYIIASTSSTLVICLLFLSCLLGYKTYRSRNISKRTPRIESFLQKNTEVYPKRYTYAQVKRMTRTFAEKLGQGGFGVVYRGCLSDGRQIAVKMLKDSKADVEEFINEVASISRTSHVNVVTLLGFCLEGPKRALIYDYMPNGSLERYAFKCNSKIEKTLSWEKLFDIAVGIARGLEYLHRGCNTRIVHFDIKPHNILLDQDFCPKISDFGLAKLCLNKESVISIGGARGTIGYIAPEVYSKQFGAVSSKSDVYSYGMMLLEMVGAREKNIHANSESSSQYFPEWIYEHLDEYCVSASEISGEIIEIARKMIVVGLWCIQLSATNRPTMTRVVEMLEGSTSGLELPSRVLLS